jgi:hypothetical protein
MIVIAGQSPAPSESMVAPTEVVSFSLIEKFGVITDLTKTVIYINEDLAFKNAEFLPNFDGAESSFDRVGDSLLFVIDPIAQFSLGASIGVRIQTKDLNGKSYNFSYVFKTIPSTPVLVESNPKDKDEMTNHQIIYLHFEDVIDDVNPASIGLFLNDIEIITDGEFDFAVATTKSAITKVADGVVVRLDTKDPLRDGKYRLKYFASDLLGNRLFGEIKFSIKLSEPVLPDVFPQIFYEGGVRGLDRVANLGIGDSVLVQWHKPFPRSYNGEVFFAIYQTESRLDIFDRNPMYIGRPGVTKATIAGLITNRTYNFAGRAFEVYAGTLDLSGMAMANDDLYVVPEPCTMTSSANTTDLVFNVDSTEGYPSAGILIVNKVEVIRYESKTSTSFILASSGRGLSGSPPSMFIPGDKVEMFFACQDKNSNLITATPTGSDGYAISRQINEIGILTPDYSDEEKKFFQGFDFCGYHRAMPQKTLQGIDDCPSYLGGEFNGFRGFNLYDRMLNREEVLLDQSGEPVILLRRIWNGTTCSCADARRQHPKVKSCKDCYGTTFEGGYDQYQYARRVDGRIMVKFGDTTEDLKLGMQTHMQVEYEPSCWTLPNPAVRDRDLILRFDYTNDIEYIYEVLDVTKEKLVFRHFTRQRLKLKRLDKTDIVYTYPVNYELVRRFGELLD